MIHFPRRRVLPALLLSSATLVVPAWAAADAPAKAPATRPATGPAGGQAAEGGVRKVSVEEFDELRRQKDVVVVDVRTPQEFAAGHVPGAVNLPVSGPGSEDFSERVKLLDKDKPYVVHCARGGRSAQAVDKMAKLGFTNLADFSGGMDAWRKAKKPVDKGDGK